MDLSSLTLPIGSFAVMQCFPPTALDSSRFSYSLGCTSMSHLPFLLPSLIMAVQKPLSVCCRQGRENRLRLHEEFSVCSPCSENLMETDDRVFLKYGSFGECLLGRGQHFMELKHNLHWKQPTGSIKSHS